MATRNGKIANLPNDIREQLNLRLLEGETGRELAAWLNALPEVQSVLGSQFNGSDISEVNLTHWRQGGYLQWLTERECFDSARWLADGDCEMAKTGLSAERLFNILTLRYGQLLMRWDSSPAEGVSEIVAFSQVAKKARILQGISRSLIAIHRIQSQSRCSSGDSTDRERPSPNAPACRTGETAALASSGDHNDAIAAGFVPGTAYRERRGTQGAERVDASFVAGTRKAMPEPDWGAAALRAFRKARAGTRPKVLSGQIAPADVLLNLSQTPFKAGADLAELLKAV